VLVRRVLVIPATSDPRRCKTSVVRQSAGLSVPRSPVRFRQKLQKSRLKFLFYHIELRAKLLFLRRNKSNINQSAPERLFSTAGNVMTEKRSRLTCDNIEELFYLHEVLPQVWEWEAVKKMRLV